MRDLGAIRGFSVLQYHAVKRIFYVSPCRILAPRPTVRVRLNF